MKKKLFVMLLLSGLLYINADAQFVRRRPVFSINVNAGHDRAPNRGAVWVGPEWEWRGGRYVEVPGHWIKPERMGTRWIPGHWNNTRRGSRWIPGHWR